MTRANERLRAWRGEQESVEQALRETEELALRAAERLEILKKINHVILGVESPVKIAQATLAHIRPLLPYRRISVALFDLDRLQAVIFALYPWDDTCVGAGDTFSLRDSAEHLDQLKRGGILLVDDVAASFPPSHVLHERYQRQAAEGVRSLRLHRPGRAGSTLRLVEPVRRSSRRLRPRAPRVGASDSRAGRRGHSTRSLIPGGATRPRTAAGALGPLDGRAGGRAPPPRAGLHDEIGQQLTALNYLLVGATKRRGAALPDVLAEARAVISHLLPRVHDLSLDLRPPNLDDFGLLPSLSWLFERHARQTGLQVTFVQSGLERRFRPEIEMATYRIVQETLTNVARHAGVARADVRARADREKLRLTIRDQGHGFDPDTALAGGARAGLIGMRERALLLGGKLSLASAPGAGARLTLELPLDGAGEGGVTAGSGRLSRRPNGRARSPDPPASFV